MGEVGKKIRDNLAKALIAYGIPGDAIDKMAKRIEDDVKEPVFAITKMDVAKMRVKYRPEREDVVVFAGYRDWQFRRSGDLIGAGYGCCCG